MDGLYSAASLAEYAQPYDGSEARQKEEKRREEKTWIPALFCAGNDALVDFRATFAGMTNSLLARRLRGKDARLTGAPPARE
jgi:hypothetical protein